MLGNSYFLTNISLQFWTYLLDWNIRPKKMGVCYLLFKSLTCCTFVQAISLTRFKSRFCLYFQTYNKKMRKYRYNSNYAKICVSILEFLLGIQEKEIIQLGVKLGFRVLPKCCKKLLTHALYSQRIQ